MKAIFACVFILAAVIATYYAFPSAERKSCLLAARLIKTKIVVPEKSKFYFVEVKPNKEGGFYVRGNVDGPNYIGAEFAVFTTMRNGELQGEILRLEQKAQ